MDVFGVVGSVVLIVLGVLYVRVGLRMMSGR